MNTAETARRPEPLNLNLVTMQAQEDISHSLSGRSAQLSSHEIVWRDRQPFLESKGYMLRPRLRPGWTPSWLATGKSRFYCEDFARLPVSQIVVLLWMFRFSYFFTSYARFSSMQPVFRTANLYTSRKSRRVTKSHA